MDGFCWGRAARSIGLAVAAFALVALPLFAQPVGQDGPMDDSLVVRITSPRAGEHVRGAVVITGYAADRRSQVGSGLNERDIQVWLNDASNPANLLGYAAPSLDVPADIASVGPVVPVGFARVWDSCAVTPGPYELVVWVSSLARSGARNATSVDLVVDACDGATPTPAAAPSSPAAPAPTQEPVPAAPAAVPSPTLDPALRGTVNLRCRNSGTSNACVLSGTAPEDIVPGSSADVAIEMRDGDVVRVETFSCAPTAQERQLACGFTTVGRLFQGAIFTVTFHVADGGSRVRNFTASCSNPTPRGEVCP
jgi:hypothetical protein